MAADPGPHHHEHLPRERMTVVEERDSGIGALIAGLIVAALIGFLIWLFAFSGIVFDRDTDDGGGQVTIEQEQEQQPGTDTGDTDTGGTDTGGTTDDTTTGGTGG